MADDAFKEASGFLISWARRRSSRPMPAGGQRAPVLLHGLHFHDLLFDIAAGALLLLDQKAGDQRHDIVEHQFQNLVRRAVGSAWIMPWWCACGSVIQKACGR